MSTLLIEMVRARDGMRFLSDAIEINPLMREVYVNLGNAYRKLGITSNAIICYQYALLTQPDCMKTCLNLGAAHEDDENLVDALYWYRKATAIAPAKHNNCNNDDKDDTLIHLFFASNCLCNWMTHDELFWTNNHNMAKLVEKLLH